MGGMIQLKSWVSAGDHPAGPRRPQRRYAARGDPGRSPRNRQNLLCPRPCRRNRLQRRGPEPRKHPRRHRRHSERNLARALSVVRSLSPCLLFMDELDQSDASGRGQSSGNPVAKNLFTMLLRFLSDPTNRGHVVFIGASNRPDLIDPALLRFGRVDAIVPVLLPEIADRAAIAHAAAESQNIALDSDAAALIASNSERYSAADVAALVTKARKIARNAGRPFVAPESAHQAIDTLRPATTKQADYLHPAGDRSLQRHGTAASPLRRPARGPRRTHQTDREEAAPAPRRSRTL